MAAMMAAVLWTIYSNYLNALKPVGAYAQANLVIAVSVSTFTNRV